MKPFLLALLMGLSALACRDSGDKEHNAVVAKWKLIQIRQAVYNPDTKTKEFITEDMNSKNIVYNFKANNTVVITGSSSDAGGFAKGTFHYHLTAENDASAPNIVHHYMVIDQSKWVYNISEDKLNLYQSHVDASDLILQKIR